MKTVKSVKVSDGNRVRVGSKVITRYMQDDGTYSDWPKWQSYCRQVETVTKIDLITKVSSNGSCEKTFDIYTENNHKPDWKLSPDCVALWDESLGLLADGKQPKIGDTVWIYRPSYKIPVAKRITRIALFGTVTADVTCVYHDNPNFNLRENACDCYSSLESCCKAYNLNPNALTGIAPIRVRVPNMRLAGVAVA